MRSLVATEAAGVEHQIVDAPPIERHPAPSGTGTISCDGLDPFAIAAD